MSNVQLRVDTIIMSGIIDRHTLMASSRVVKIKDNEGEIQDT